MCQPGPFTPTCSNLIPFYKLLDVALLEPNLPVSSLLLLPQTLCAMGIGGGHVFLLLIIGQGWEEKGNL